MRIRALTPLIAAIIGACSWSTDLLGQASVEGARPVARVNGAVITMAEVEAVFKQAGPTATPLTEGQKKQAQLEALYMLIDEQLMTRFLRQHGPKIDDAEVKAKIAELEAGLKKQNKTLVDFFKETGQTQVQLKDNLLSMLQWIGYWNDKLKEQDFKRYYELNKDFFDRVTVRANHIVLRTTSGGGDVEKQALRAKLQGLRQDILAGKLDFGEAAKKHSQCSSAANGGDIGYFPRKLAVDENFARTAFAMKVGELSDLVETDFGIHLITVTDRKSGPATEYGKVKDEVRHLCMEEARLAILMQQRQAAKVEILLPQPGK